MATFEWIILLLLGAALLAALARRVGAPYPTFLAIGGALLAFVPDAPRWTLDPKLALTLLVAPVLLDAAYDASLRDLKINWRPIAGLVLAAVAVTIVAVAFTVHALVPGMPWAIAIALGAIVAPPDAAAATAVMRQVRLPQKLVTIVEGESLLNDVSALLVYRVAIMTMLAGHVGVAEVTPVLVLTVFGSLAAGFAFVALLMPFLSRVRDVPTALILQFSATFGVWIAAEAIGLSGILTLVAYAMTISRRRGAAMPARMRVPVFAVWETVVFILNAFAFVLIGLQLRPIWERLQHSGTGGDYLAIALAVLGVTILARVAWVLAYKFVLSPGHGRGSAGHRLGGAVVLSWAGMRGIVTLAAAFAIPEALAGGTPFPYRDLVLVCAFTVVLGTLVLQGLTLKPLIRLVNLRDDDPVGREVRLARAEAYGALLAAIEGDDSLPAKLLRKEYAAVVESNQAGQSDEEAIDRHTGGPLRRRALSAARVRADELRRDGSIGDAAFRVIVQEIDWAELSAGGGIERREGPGLSHTA
jgi:CPA1 family monovalent cation:H+ antiporter